MNLDNLHRSMSLLYKNWENILLFNVWPSFRFWTLLAVSDAKPSLFCDNGIWFLICQPNHLVWTKLKIYLDIWETTVRERMYKVSKNMISDHSHGLYVFSCMHLLTLVAVKQLVTQHFVWVWWWLLKKKILD